MGRDTSGGLVQPLLKGQAEQNIGNSAIIYPSAGNPTVIPDTNPPRIINLQGGSGAGQTTSVIMTVARLVQGAQNPNPGVPGPITGILEYGNGGRFTRVEFDVPVGPFVGNFGTALSSIEPQDGGVIVTVPTAVVRAYMRYDNNLLAPVLNQNPPISLAQLMGVAVTGPGGPVGPSPAEPVLAKSMACYFSKRFSLTYKTLYCYCGPAAIQVGATYVYYALPALTRNIRILRLPFTSQMDVELRDGVLPLERFRIPASTTPNIPITGNVSIVGITSPLPADAVTFLAIVCEVGI